MKVNLERIIEHLYDKAINAGLMNGSIREWFRTTVEVRQGCLLSPTLFNIFIGRIMSGAVEEYDGKGSKGGRNITNMQFANDIDAIAEGKQQVGAALVKSLDKTCTSYKLKISVGNGIQGTMTETGNDQKFQIHRSNFSDDGLKSAVLSRNEQTFAALTKLKLLWRDNSVSLGLKVKLMRSLVMCIFLYACESWILKTELAERTQTFEM